MDTFSGFVVAFAIILLGISNIMTQNRLNQLTREPNKTYIIKLSCPLQVKK